MKAFIVRLRNYEGSIIDGEIIHADNEEQAIIKYKKRCERLGIFPCFYDYYTAEECFG